MRYLLICIISMLAFSCSNHPERSKEEVIAYNSTLSEYLKRLPSYAQSVDANGDTILLGFSKGTTEFDTSWSLIISKSGNIINGRYHQLLPFIVDGRNNYLDDTTKSLFYEGVYFDISVKKWNDLLIKSGLTDYVVKDSSLYTGCFHCPRYTAYYNSKMILSSKADYLYLKTLDTLLNGELLHKLLEKKNAPPAPVQLEK